MASTQFAATSGRPVNVKTENFDMDSFFDFSHATTQPSPATASSSRADTTPKNAAQDWNAVSPFDQPDERQYFNGPSHDYTQYKQQVGLPMGSMATIPQHSMYDGYSSGIGDMGFESGFGGWSSGIDLDSEMTVDFNNPQSAMPAMFFPPTTDGPSETFVNPGAIGGQEEPSSNVGRLWPGMHSQHAQQAAMQKQAQQMAATQRQMKVQHQHAQFRQVGNAPQSQAPSQQGPSHGKKPSHGAEPHVEESISRLLHNMRHNSAISDDDDDSTGGMLPHVARMKKDEEEMDEDERLLASDEGKKLSSKERRQLRNKVSARAFRSRRKEYISQLEGELAMKTQEANNYRSQNSALVNENERYRMLIETLLRHPAFTPFINDISKDPSLLGSLQQPQSQPQHQASVTPTPQAAQPQPQQQQQQQQQPPAQQDSKPEYMNFDASQLQIPQPQQHTERINLATIPENDFSKLNINGFNSMNFNGFRSVNAFAVTQMPNGPDPVDLLRLPLAYTASDNFATTSTAALTSCDSDMTLLLAKLDRAAGTLKHST